MSALSEVRLYGALGEQFGRVHHLAVNSPGEAIRALMANYRDFEQAFIAGAYRVWSGTTRVKQAEDIVLPSSQREVIRIAPVVAGAGGGGLGNVLIGAALIAVAVGTGGFGIGMAAAWAAGGTTLAGAIAGSIGVSLVLGGVIQMLSPAPKQQAGAQDEAKPSYGFNGATNVTAQGNPVPIGYGRLIVGSAVISAGVATEDIPL